MTRDADFLRLSATGTSHAGIFYFPRDRGTGDMVRTLLLAHQVLSPREMLDHVEYA